MKHIDIVFDGPPSHESGRFVEVEDGTGKSISIGEWIEQADGLWALRISDPAKVLPLICQSKEVYVAWTNSDLAEGKGWLYPLAISESAAQAIRLGRGKDVQGCNCTVTAEMAFRIGSHWYAPARILSPTTEDVEEDKRRAARKAALEKAKAAGLTEADLAALNA